MTDEQRKLIDELLAVGEQLRVSQDTYDALMNALGHNVPVKDGALPAAQRELNYYQVGFNLVAAKAREALAAMVAENAAMREALGLYYEAYTPDGHHAPHDCFATGPHTGPDTESKIRDYIECPGCRAEAARRALAQPKEPTDV